MRLLILLLIGIGIVSALPLQDGQSSENKAQNLKNKLEKLHFMLRELSEKVDEAKTGLSTQEEFDELDSSLNGDSDAKDKREQEDFSERYEELESNTHDENDNEKLNAFVRKLSPEDVDVLKKVKSKLQYLKKALEDQSSDTTEEKREQNTDLTEDESVKTEKKIPNPDQVPEDVKELLKKFRSREKYLQAALEEEKKHPGPDEADKGSVEKPEGSSQESNAKRSEGTFGSFEADKRGTDEESKWDSEPVEDNDLGAKSALNEVEMRLLKDLKYARNRGVNIKELLEDLKAERKKRSE